VVLELKNDLVFVSIASYRDPQLIATVEDCIRKSRTSTHLRFGICWQHAPDEIPLPFRNDERFRILDIPFRESQGACWARAEVMKSWRGERTALTCITRCLE
jgi:hypothetical protein